jgi:hypothetical protein
MHLVAAPNCFVYARTAAARPSMIWASTTRNLFSVNFTYSY